MKNKKVIIAIIVAVLLISIIGVTFAAYTYSRQGTSNSKQVVGDIYMHYTESNSLTLSNATPSSTYIANNYFEFTVDGKNTTTNKDIIYDIVLSHGDLPQGKAETNRIDDKFLKFRLVEVIDNSETEILNNNSYSDLTNKRIYVETIPKNTGAEVVHTYRLYMWIGDEVVIGNINQDYTESEWSNLFASIKVNVTGDFNEKFVTLSDVISKAMNNGGSSYIKSYSATKGDASFDTQDTVGTNSNKLDVLYYTGTDALSHGNVLFAGYCWQIIRTTDTGGLRIIYNGPAENNKCLTSRNSGGTLKGINAKESSVSSRSTDISSITNFGTGYDYDLDAGTFTLTGTSELSGKTWANNSSELIGTYACADNTTTCNELWYIGHYQSTTEASVAAYIIGTTAHYSQIGTSYYNAYLDSPALVGYMYNKAYTYKSGAKTGDYANSVTWDSTNNIYVLDSSTTTNLTAPDETHHYVCDTDCTKVRFYYYLYSPTYYYVLLENGDINPVYAMLNGKTQNETVDANINRYSSAIKGQLDNWYKKNIDSLNSSVKELIDTGSVYCNDRSSSSTFGSWNKDAANLTTTLNFYQYSDNKDLRCANVTDRFSVGNEKANLTYPVGLITEPERKLINSNYAKTGKNYWGVSPRVFSFYYAYVRGVDIAGATSVNPVRYAYGARPVVTLSADADISEGDGSYATPYVIGDKISR